MVVVFYQHSNVDSAAATSSRLVGLGMNGPHRASGDEPRIAVSERSVCSISFVVQFIWQAQCQLVSQGQLVH